MMAHPAPVLRNRDFGRQPERTGLAWSRSALAASVVGLMSLRTGLLSGEAFVLVSGGLAVGIAVLMTLRAHARPRYDAHDADVTTPGSRRIHAAIASAVVAVDALVAAEVTLKLKALATLL